MFSRLSVEGKNLYQAARLLSLFYVEKCYDKCNDK